MSLSNAMAPVAHTNGYEFTQGSGYALPEYPFVAHRNSNLKPWFGTKSWWWVQASPV